MKTTALILIACLGCVAAAGDSAILRAEGGDGTKDTRTFTVRDDWTLHYRVMGVGGDGEFMLFAHLKGSTLRMPVAKTDKVDEGTVTIHRGGEYVLTVVSVDADWQLEVEDAPQG
jgi:hypothetical protein